MPFRTLSRISRERSGAEQNPSVRNLVLPYRMCPASFSFSGLDWAEITLFPWHLQEYSPRAGRGLESVGLQFKRIKDVPGLAHVMAIRASRARLGLWFGAELVLARVWLFKDIPMPIRVILYCHVVCYTRDRPHIKPLVMVGDCLSNTNSN